MAGLFAALEASALGPVLLVTKGELHEGSTRHAQGGIAAAIGPDDSTEQHLKDTIAAGAGLVDEAMARILVESAPRRIQDLERYGVSFDNEGAERAFGREGAHRNARVLHARGDRTGAAITTALAEQIESGRIAVREHTLATDVVLENGRTAGVRALDQETGTECTFESDAVVLATGGAGAAFSHTTNPPVATGDGIALAFDAGAEVTDLEFYQFHPTAFRQPGAPPFLISEALRGEGAVLRNTGGDAFMPRYHELADLAPRDVVARAMVAEMRDAGSDHVWLDCTALDRVDPIERFPGIAAFCGERGSRPAPRPGTRRPRRSLPDGRRAHGFVGAHDGGGALRLRGNGGNGRARREPAGEQLPARDGRVREAGGRAHRGGGGLWRWSATRTRRRWRRGGRRRPTTQPSSACSGSAPASSVRAMRSSRGWTRSTAGLGASRRLRERDTSGAGWGSSRSCC